MNARKYVNSRTTQITEQDGNGSIKVFPQLQQRAATTKRVFLCYSRADLRYAQRLLIHLASCPDTSGLVTWDDSQIRAGSLWQNEISSALAAAQFAILLLSADFLASPFITTYELPRLLQAVSMKTTHILPVILHPCLFEESLLAPFQTFNDPSKPLSLLPSRHREVFWVNIVRFIVQTPPPFCSSDL